MNNPYAAPEAALSEPIGGGGTYEPKIFSLDGRIGRLRYLAYGWVYAVLAIIPATLLAALLHPKNFLATFFAYAPLHVATVIAARRRMQDLDTSGWFSLLMLVPFLNGLVSLYLLFKAGTPYENRFGPEPGPNSRGLVIVGWIVPAIAVLGIVAAIAIPAYQGYMHRAASVQQQR